MHTACSMLHACHMLHCMNFNTDVKPTSCTACRHQNRTSMYGLLGSLLKQISRQPDEALNSPQ